MDKLKQDIKYLERKIDKIKLDIINFEKDKNMVININTKILIQVEIDKLKSRLERLEFNLWKKERESQ